jgi:hypothetical protein
MLTNKDEKQTCFLLLLTNKSKLLTNKDKKQTCFLLLLTNKSKLLTNKDEKQTGFLLFQPLKMGKTYPLHASFSRKNDRKIEINRLPAMNVSLRFLLAAFKKE